MWQNIHSLLAFPKFNKAVSVLPSGAKAELNKLFYYHATPIG